MNVMFETLTSVTKYTLLPSLLFVMIYATYTDVNIIIYYHKNQVIVHRIGCDINQFEICIFINSLLWILCNFLLIVKYIIMNMQ